MRFNKDGQIVEVPDDDFSGSTSLEPGKRRRAGTIAREGSGVTTITPSSVAAARAGIAAGAQILKGR